MNIQLALDRLTRDRCFRILEETESNIDWIEIGTGVIKEYGMAIVRDIKAAYPHKTVIADMKTCDAGIHEAMQAFEAGADVTTVMAFSANRTIADSLEAARQHGKRVMIDLLGVTEQKRMNELLDLGVDLVSLHFGKDMQQEGQFQADFFTLLQEFPHFEVAVAGGISLQTLPEIMKKKPTIIIVGSAITQAENCNEAASRMKGMIKEYESHDSCCS